jgi:hypothetical protein
MGFGVYRPKLKSNPEDSLPYMSLASYLSSKKSSLSALQPTSHNTLWHAAAFFCFVLFFSLATFSS